MRMAPTSRTWWYWHLLLCVLAMPALQAQQLNIAAKGEMAAGSKAMVATAHPLASDAALEMLQKGGNAVDAAVAAAFAIGVVEPDGSGLGGGGSMVIYLKEPRSSVYINYYTETSGRIEELKYTSDDSKSARAVTIPGTVAGLVTALEKYGTLPLSVVVVPAIRYAEQGFAIDQTLASIILDNVEILQQYPSTADVYLRDGFPLMFGDTLRMPELAKTLQLIGDKGRPGFYEGPVAEAIVKAVTENGGMLTLEDLSSFHAYVTEPVRGTYRGYEVLSAAPPQSGVTIIEALNMLENADLKQMGHYSISDATLHLMAETMRRVYADRIAYMEDPRFRHIPVEGLTSKAYAKERYKSIDPNIAQPPTYRQTEPGDPKPYDTKPSEGWRGEGSTLRHGGEDLSDLAVTAWGEVVRLEEAVEYGGHTTHLTVVDESGNAVSLTQTLGTFFGSGLTAAGVLLNTSMSNYSLRAKVNSIAPRKQPRSSISPTLLLKDGQLFLSVGTPGAARIMATVIQLIVNAVDFGMNAAEVNNAPRFFCQKFDDFLHLESRIGEQVQTGLERRGHTIKVYGEFDLFFGGAQVILRESGTGMLYGSADARRGGTAVGY